MSHEDCGIEVVSRLNRAIGQGCDFLDRESFHDWLTMFEEQASYSISSYSRDLLKDDCWLSMSKPELKALVEGLGNHVRDTASLARFAIPTSYVQLSEDMVRVTSRLVVYRTDSSGVSGTFAVGRYQDVWRTTDPDPRLTERVVELDTRNLGSGCHVPL